MDVTQLQSSASSQTSYTPTASAKASPATDVNDTGDDASSATLKTVSFATVDTYTAATANAEIDKYVADLKPGQRLTVLYSLTQFKATAPLVVTPVDSSGLVPGPHGILYRPGVVNPYGTQPAAGISEVHNINWGGYESPQATPEPTQIIDDVSYGAPSVDEGEILILPAADAPDQRGAQQSSETVYTPAAPVLTVDPLIVASRAGLHPSTNPLDAANVEVSSGWQWQAPSSARPSPTSPMPPQSSFSGGTAMALTGGTATIEHVPIINTGYASIVTKNADGTTTVNENSAGTTAADLSKFLTGFLKRVTVDADGTITVYSSSTATSKSASSSHFNMLDTVA